MVMCKVKIKKLAWISILRILVLAVGWRGMHKMGNLSLAYDNPRVWKAGINIYLVPKTVSWYRLIDGLKILKNLLTGDLLSFVQAVIEMQDANQLWMCVLHDD